MFDPSPWILKTVPLKFSGAELKLDLSHALFSSNDIDAGSRLLLKALGKVIKNLTLGRVLDIGCGTGVLGLACKKAFPESEVFLRDRDALACEFSSMNARKNKIRQVTVERALFLDGIEPKSFDLILSNVPAKAGTPVLDDFFKRLPAFIRPGGLGAIVVVNNIADAARASLEKAWAGQVNLEDEPVRTVERGGDHTVFFFGHAAQKDDEIREPLSIYMRGEETRVKSSPPYRHQGFWGLPEFDTASFASELGIELLGNIKERMQRALVINPGTGRLASALRLKTRARIDLCGRDWLSLKASRHNLALNGQDFNKLTDSEVFLPAWPEEVPENDYDMMALFLEVTPRVNSFPWSWAHAARSIKSGGLFLVIGTSADMDRFSRHKEKGFALLNQKKKKGWLAALYKNQVLE